MRELLKRVLNARTIGYPLPPSIVKDIEAELAKPEPEPVAWKTKDIFGRALFTDSNAVYKRWIYEGMECESLFNEELAKPEPEPVAYLTIDNAGKEHVHLGKMSDSTLKDWNIKQQSPLYTRPPAQQKPLADGEIENIIGIPKHYKAFYEVARAIEQAHGIK